MSRVRRAVTTAGFVYVQFALAIVSGLVLVPLLLSHLGTRSYGLWLVSGELLAYAGMLDLGVLSIVPWSMARAEGAGDERLMRRVLVDGLTIGFVAGVAVALLAGVLWWLPPPVLPIAEADRNLLAGPVGVVVLSIALTYPARVFNAALIGLQDVTFTGVTAIAQTAGGLAITIALLLSGHGLYSLAFGAAVPPLLGAIASLMRLMIKRPTLFREWQRPTRAGLVMIVPDGVGAWMGALGWQMVSATAGVVVTLVGHAGLVAVYACTSKLSQVLFQLSRVLPDSGLVALAQLSGEGDADRMRRAVLTIVRVHLVLTGAAAGAMLAFNPLFVAWWVGTEFFGGLVLNIVLAGGLLFMGLTHGLVCSAAVVGNRPTVGLVTLAYGVVNVLLAMVFGTVWGLPGVAAAPIFSGIVTLLPLTLRLLEPVTGIGMRAVVRGVWLPWLKRVTPYLAVTFVGGLLSTRLSSPHAPGLIALGGLAALVYLWWMRPLYRDLPLDRRWRNRLVQLRLGPVIGAEPLERSTR